MESKIIFYGTGWCPDCHRAKRILARYNVDFQYIDIDQDLQAREFVEKTNNGNRSVPTIVFPEGDILVEPGDEDLTERIKLLLGE